MASKSSKALPYIVLVIVIGTLAYEGYSGETLDLETYLPILIALGVGGIPLAAVKKAVEARKAIPKSLQDEIREEIKKNLPERRG